jgi:FkbM family methyltransferase
MNLQRIDGHTIDLDLLTNSGTIVDLGCRGFVFANYFKNLGYSVIAVDADPLVFNTVPSDIVCINKAICTERKEVKIYNTLTESGYTSDVRLYHNDGGVTVECVPLQEIEPNKDYELLKIDIEGGEYPILSHNLFKPRARQITVEFHEHNLKELHDTYFKSVVDNLSKWYDLVYIMENNQYKYIDCLFIRR